MAGIAVAVGIFIAVCNLVIYLANENSLLKKFYKRTGRWLFITNRLNSNARPTLFWAWDILDPRHAVRGVVPQWALLSYRCATLCLFGFTILYQGLFSGYGEPLFNWLTFYTNWTFVAFGLTAVLGIAVILEDMFIPRSPEKQEWTFLRKTCLLAHVVTGSCAIFLTLFYWTTLYDADDDLTFDNFARHGINCIALVVEMLINRLPVVTYHFQACFIYGTIYIVFMWSYYGASGDWVYSTLDFNDATSLIYYAIVPLMLLFGFGCMYGLAAFREGVLVNRMAPETYTTMDVEIQMGDRAVDNKDSHAAL